VPVRGDIPDPSELYRIRDGSTPPTCVVELAAVLRTDRPAAWASATASGAEADWSARPS
jgi:hypothetical protein